MSIRLAVFDCDGTLVDGQAAVCNAMAQAFSQAGLPAPEAGAVRRSVGLSLPQAVRTLAPDARPTQWEDAVSAYRLAFRQARASGQLSEPLFAGMADVLASLRQAGWVLGVATGKSDRGLKSCLASHGLLDHFSTLQTADRHPSKPHPAMLEEAMAQTFARPPATVMIGDTAYDMEMAAQAGTRAIGVAWGYHAESELLASGAQAVARTPAELRELLQ